MTPKEIEQVIGEIESSLDRLYALYNQYFMGIEKTEPLVQRKALDRKINDLRKEKIRNTAQRFRFQTQIQKYNTQQIFWRRVCKEIEEGTYKRHVMLARRRQAERIRQETERAADATPLNIDIDLSAMDLDEDLKSDLGFDENRKSDFGPAIDEPHGIGLDEPFSNAPAPNHDLEQMIDGLDDPFSQPRKAASKRPQKQAAKTAPAPRGAPAKPPIDPEQEEALKSFFKKPKPAREAPASGGARKAAELDAARIQKLYRTYLAAKKKCRESTDNLSVEKLAGTLNKQFQAKGGNVDFKVVIRDGKAIIKTVKLGE